MSGNTGLPTPRQQDEQGLRAGQPHGAPHTPGRRTAQLLTARHRERKGSARRIERLEYFSRGSTDSAPAISVRRTALAFVQEEEQSASSGGTSSGSRKGPTVPVTPCQSPGRSRGSTELARCAPGQVGK